MFLYVVINRALLHFYMIGVFSATEKNSFSKISNLFKSLVNNVRNDSRHFKAVNTTTCYLYKNECITLFGIKSKQHI